MSKQLIWLFVCLPASARLYFYQPPLEALEPGDVIIDLGLTYTTYDHPDLGPEKRWNLPDMHFFSQMGNRVMLGVDVSGIYRPDPFPRNRPPAKDKVGLGDVTLSAWFDYVRIPERGLTLKAFFMGKVPVADDGSFFGTDETDIFWGTTLDWQGNHWFANGLARFDIISRFGRGNEAQWDYLTVSTRLGRSLKNGKLFFEGWYRYRSLDSTSLLGLGWETRLAGDWHLFLLGGVGVNHHYVPSLDSNLEEMGSLFFRWRPTRAGFARWLRSSNG